MGVPGSQRLKQGRDGIGTLPAAGAEIDQLGPAAGLRPVDSGRRCSSSSSLLRLTVSFSLLPVALGGGCRALPSGRRCSDVQLTFARALCVSALVAVHGAGELTGMYVLSRTVISLCFCRCHAHASCEQPPDFPPARLACAVRQMADRDSNPEEGAASGEARRW